MVVFSKAEYNRLLKPKLSFVAFMQASPLMGLGIHLKRDSSLTRESELGATHFGHGAIGCYRWGRLHAIVKRLLPAIDSLITATALYMICV